MSFRSATLFVLAILALARAAAAQPVLDVQPADVAPGAPMLITVTGADPNARAVLFFSVGLGVTTLGPIRTPCAPLVITVALRKPLREISRGQVSSTGTYQVMPLFPVAVPARLDDRPIFAQVATAKPVRTPSGCAWRVQTTNVASFTVRIP
jgi:hypothetical protein